MANLQTTQTIQTIQTIQMQKMLSELINAKPAVRGTTLVTYIVPGSTDM